MNLQLTQELENLAKIDFFDEASKASFIGRPFYFDYSSLKLLSNDSWKNRASGVPAGAFLLARYVGEEEVDEAILLRVIKPTSLPTDSDVVMAMVDHYKETPGSSSNGELDSYTRAEFQFSALECRVLGTFYRLDEITRFAGDIDNFFSPHNYSVVKPDGQLLEYIVNFRATGIPGGSGEERIGRVRYSSSRRHEVGSSDVPVYISANDFLGKRTALFGMTRTGKSNSVKKIIQATATLSEATAQEETPVDKPIGQIVFDINGEYSNANQQDDGTAIFEQYPDLVDRYSVLEKKGFKVMKLNFYTSILEGFGLIQGLLSNDSADYVRAFLSIDWEAPDSGDHGARSRYERLVAAYQACLYRAGFSPPKGWKAKFSSSADIRKSDFPGLKDVDPKSGLDPEENAQWFEAVWRHYADPSGPFAKYPEAHGGREWANEDLKSVLKMLTRSSRPGSSSVSNSGHLKLRPASELHTPSAATSFEDDIVQALREGRIILIDLSQGDPSIQRTYSERVCARIFSDSMKRFIDNEPANFIQLYFEEAHNLFPKKDDKDLTQIYNRLAKEGQKLRLGLCYATQEVSSISSSILKNTQNWFVSHLNNADEIRELNKYYDFEDFSDSLRRTIDKGFIRLKTDTNSFIVPIQVDVFRVKDAD